MVPDYLVLGHVTKDFQGASFRWGGTALYAAITALRLGYRAAVVTVAALEPGIKEVLDGVSLRCRPAAQTTTFDNRYLAGRRQQFWRAIAEPIALEDVPPLWRKARIVHLGPVAQELSPRILDIFSQTFVGVTPQGWLRCWEEDGRVGSKLWEEATSILPHISALVLSLEDVHGDLATVRYYASYCPIVVVTEGARGARVHAEGRWYRIPAFPARAIDPTGAGDVFAAAYFIRLVETGDPCDAGLFASCAASFAVEAIGSIGIPHRAQIAMRRDQYPKL